jgi:hypothetical protein
MAAKHPAPGRRPPSAICGMGALRDERHHRSESLHGRESHFVNLQCHERLLPGRRPVLASRRRPDVVREGGAVTAMIDAGPREPAGVDSGSRRHSASCTASARKPGAAVRRDSHRPASLIPLPGTATGCRSVAATVTVTTPEPRSRSGAGPRHGHRRLGRSAAQESMNDFSCLERLGWRSLRSALASICRMRSRVTSKSCPTSSSV